MLKSRLIVEHASEHDGRDAPGVADILQRFSERLERGSPRRGHGKEADGGRWRELGEEVLAAELGIAAARATVSSVPSLHFEHLRRRLWKIDRKQARAEGRELADEKASAPTVERVNDCPDCGGSGLW